MERNIVYVGRKPAMSYVSAVLVQFGRSNSVVLKARGRAISKAVDVAEITRRRFIQDATIKEIKIGTEELTSEDGRTTNVSTIDIILTR